MPEAYKQMDLNSKNTVFYGEKLWEDYSKMSKNSQWSLNNPGTKLELFSITGTSGTGTPWHNPGPFEGTPQIPW